MEFHLVSVKKISCVLPDMETGIEFRFVLKEDEIKDADINTFFQHVVFLSLLNLFRVHLGDIEQGAVSPYFQFGKLDFSVNFRIVIHQYPYVKDSLFIIFMYFSEVGIQDAGFFDVFRLQVEYSGQESGTGFFVSHDFLKGKINFGFH